jgi:4-hydroxyphenylacetate 3-monooxygenase
MPLETSADAIATKRPFTGSEYLDSLCDGREVWIYGEQVRRVTAHPAFRNACRSIARLYDALHEPISKEVLTCSTDTGSGGFTHRCFRIPRSREDLMRQREAIVHWARLTYGWMGRTPDYKAGLMCTFGVHYNFYDRFADNARHWYERVQESVLFVNHALINPPVDRARKLEELKDLVLTIQKDTDAGIYVSGAKAIATSAALSHYGFITQGAGTDDSDLTAMFMAPMNAPGVKLFCRNSYERSAGILRKPFDYPLSSRFDENDAILVFDNVFIPWENVLVHRDVNKLKKSFPRFGFIAAFQFHSCTRLAVKLDFLVGLLVKAVRLTGVDEFRGTQVALGEVIAWRNLFWALSDAMACSPVRWAQGTVLPNVDAGGSYRILAGDAYRRIKQIIEKLLASALVCVPSSAHDFCNAEIEGYLRRYLRGSYGIDYKERTKIMKLLWDAIGTEFGSRHELYELNYSGSHEMVRLDLMHRTKNSGALDEFIALAESCMDDYDENGWRDSSWINSALPDCGGN